MMNIVFLDRSTIGPAVDIHRPRLAHNWQEYDRTRQDQVIERLKEADVVVTNKVPIWAEALEHLPRLKMISVAATGYDVIDTAACTNRGVTVSNVRGYAVTTVPEHVFALIFALQRNIVGYRQDVIEGAWQKAAQFCFFNHSIRDLRSTRLGVIGAGAIGRAVGRIGSALGMDVVFAAHKGQTSFGSLYKSFEEVIETSDVISLHTPLKPNTRDLISVPEFERMKRRPILINTSRGGLVNETALVDALNKGHIRAAGFDVLTSEPPRDENPLLEILGRPNVIVTPHVAWASDEAMSVVWKQTIENIENFHAGAPTNVLT